MTTVRGRGLTTNTDSARRCRALPCKQATAPCRSFGEQLTDHSATLMVLAKDAEEQRARLERIESFLAQKFRAAVPELAAPARMAKFGLMCEWSVPKTVPGPELGQITPPARARAALLQEAAELVAESPPTRRSGPSPLPQVIQEGRKAILEVEEQLCTLSSLLASAVNEVKEGCSSRLEALAQTLRSEVAAAHEALKQEVRAQAEAMHGAGESAKGELGRVGHSLLSLCRRMEAAEQGLKLLALAPSRPPAAAAAPGGGEWLPPAAVTGCEAAAEASPRALGAPAGAAAQALESCRSAAQALCLENGRGCAKAATAAAAVCLASPVLGSRFPVIGARSPTLAARSVNPAGYEQPKSTRHSCPSAAGFNARQTRSPLRPSLPPPAWAPELQLKAALAHAASDLGFRGALLEQPMLRAASTAGGGRGANRRVTLAAAWCPTPWRQSSGAALQVEDLGHGPWRQPPAGCPSPTSPHLQTSLVREH